MKSKEKGGVKVVNWVLNIVIVVLSFFFVMTAGVMIEELYTAFAPTYDEDNFYYDITDERFSRMVGGYHANVQAGFEGNADMKEYYGVAKYYEAASLYHAYTVAGNEELAMVFQQKMEQAEEEMGSWSITKEPINKQLGIEE